MWNTSISPLCLEAPRAGLWFRCPRSVPDVRQTKCVLSWALSISYQGPGFCQAHSGHCPRGLLLTTKWPWREALLLLSQGRTHPGSKCSIWMWWHNTGLWESCPPGFCCGRGDQENNSGHTQRLSAPELCCLTPPTRKSQMQLFKLEIQSLFAVNTLWVSVTVDD